MPHTKEQRQEWYRANRDRILREKREQYKLVGPIKRDYQRTYRAKNIEKVQQADRDRWPERKHDENYRRKQREKASAWYQKNRAYVAAKMREMRLIQKYGLTEADYQALSAAQDGKCAICRAEPKEGWPLVVDHCHETGVVRGLLCDGCNQAIGRLGDNAESLQRALSYLARFEDQWRKASA